MGSASAVLDTTPVDHATAAAIEAAEARAWADLYAAAPAEFAAHAGLSTRVVAGALVLCWAATGRRYFSRTIGLGVGRPATPEAIECALEAFERAGITRFLLQSLPHCRPDAYERWLADRGLERFDAQDRIVRGPGVVAPPAAAGEDGIVVQRVGRDTAEEWSAFVQSAYRLDTGPWLPALIGRRGWRQYVARREGRIVAARGMYRGPDGVAWLGMDAPVPGITTDDHEPDAAICATICADAPAVGAHTLIADIEAPSPGMDTPAYRVFAALGFRRPYVRTHWTRR